MRPACMDAAEYAGWQAINSTITTRVNTQSPCADCIPDFAAEMRDTGECDGTPGVIPRHSGARADPAKRREYNRIKAMEYRRRRGAKDKAKECAERRVRAVALFDTGLTTREVAEWMHLQPATVRRYRREAMAA